MAIINKVDLKNDALLRQVFFVGVIFLIFWALWAFLYTSSDSLADYQTTGRVYPQSDVINQLNKCTGSGCASGHWAVLDEISYDFTDFVYDDDFGGDEVEEFEMTSIAPGKAISEIEVNFRAFASGGCVGGGGTPCDIIEARIFIDGAYYGPQSITLPTTDLLHSLTFSGAWSGDEELRVELTRRSRGTGSNEDTVRLTRLFADITFTQPNNPPTVNSVITTPLSPTVVTQGDIITFKVEWSDDPGDSARVIICKTNAIAPGPLPGCPGDEWIAPSLISATSPIILSYKTVSNDALTNPNNYYVFVCDNPGGECSSTVLGVTNGTFTVNAITAELYGWSWGYNVGWISFDSNDCDGEPPGGDGITDGFNNPNCPIGLPTGAYGVELYTPTGDLSGYAWSSNVGWINFDRAVSGNPPDTPFNGGSGPIARLEGVNLRGWARALSNGGGWDGWIKLGD